MDDIPHRPVSAPQPPNPDIPDWLDPSRADVLEPGYMSLGPAACFTPGRPVDVGPVVERLTRGLAHHAASAADNPFANPVMLLALDIQRQLHTGALSHAELEAMVQHLTVHGYIARAARLRRYIGGTEQSACIGLLRQRFERLARSDDDPGGAPDFDTFKAAVEAEHFGIVMTAHPTFSMTGDLMRGLAALASGRDTDGRDLGHQAAIDLIAKAAGTEHRPDPDLSLTREHTLSLEAIDNIQAALRRSYDVLFDVARELFPDRWTELTPRLLTVATWVGYDLDGRSDIRWTDTLRKRVIVQRRQLAHYVETLRSIRAAAPAEATDLMTALELVESRLALAITRADDEIEAFGEGDPGEPEARQRIQAISRKMYRSRDQRLLDASGLITLCNRALGHATDEVTVKRLLILRAELATHGLGTAHTHVRINATQVHNALRKAVDLNTDPNDPRYRQSYLDKLSELLDGTEPSTINFGSIQSERTSVKQMFMVLAQMLKYGDQTAPIRFLIAESETAFTVLAALYFAKVFGVAEHVDISPLFETERALRRGSRVIDALLQNKHYRAYVRQRGRLCVQTGYSDAGRYLGQTAAAASIERLRLRLIRVMAKHGLHDVQLLIFDTHGESIGRGGHPLSLRSRLTYIDPPYTRALMRREKVTFKQESSFQGGDGYLLFVNPAVAFTVVSRVLEHALDRTDTGSDDPFYREDSYILEFFTTVKEFQVDLMQDRNYGVLLSAFAPNLLFPSGSRPTKRQHDDPSEIERAMASQLRAIPHNAVLMQLGVLANSVGGAGAAIANDPERFRDLYRSSARMRALLGIVEYGIAASDPRVMRAYIDTLDPGHWIERASVADPEDSEGLLAVAKALEGSDIHERQTRVYRKLSRDLATAREVIGRLRRGNGSAIPANGASALLSGESRQALDLLHAIRIAAIHEIFRLAVRVPQFSNRHDVTLAQVVARILHLDVGPTVAMLKEIFPAEEDVLDEDFGEPATYRSDDSQSYRLENERLFQPMEGLYALTRRISTAVAHHIGFFG